MDAQTFDDWDKAGLAGCIALLAVLGICALATYLVRRWQRRQNFYVERAPAQECERVWRVAE